MDHSFPTPERPMANRFTPPVTLPSNHAFGELVIKSENGPILVAEMARVDLTTGALHVEKPISHTGHDWGCDTFFFRLSARGERFEVDEGCEIDPNLDFCVLHDLENLQKSWHGLVAKHLEASFPKTRLKTTKPRM